MLLVPASVTGKRTPAFTMMCCRRLSVTCISGRRSHWIVSPETGEQLFGGTGSNQAITIGGVDRNGKEAVNDLTERLKKKPFISEFTVLIRQIL